MKCEYKSITDCQNKKLKEVIRKEELGANRDQEGERREELMKRLEAYKKQGELKQAESTRKLEEYKKREELKRAESMKRLEEYKKQEESKRAELRGRLEVNKKQEEEDPCLTFGEALCAGVKGLRQLMDQFTLDVAREEDKETVKRLIQSHKYEDQKKLGELVAKGLIEKWRNE